MKTQKAIRSSAIYPVVMGENAFRALDLKEFKVRLYFSKHFDDIDESMADELIEACSKASLNLISRRHIWFTHAAVYRDYIDLELLIPRRNLHTFTCNQLRGIARYLTTTYPEKYKPMLDGNRMFHYVVQGE